MNTLSINTIAQTINAIDNHSQARDWMQSVNFEFNAEYGYGIGTVRSSEHPGFTVIALDFKAETVKSDISAPVKIDSDAAWFIKEALTK